MNNQEKTNNQETSKEVDSKKLTTNEHWESLMEIENTLKKLIQE